MFDCSFTTTNHQHSTMAITPTKSLVCAALMALAQSSYMSGQSIWFRFNNGLEDAHNLLDIRKITYGTDDTPALTVYFTDNTSVSYNYPDILSYYFSDSSVNVAERDALNNNRFIVYPNPADNSVTLSWLSKNNDPYQVVIYDSNGRVVDSFQVPSGAPGLRNHSLALNQLQSGVYIVRLMNKNAIQSTRLIKN